MKNTILFFLLISVGITYGQDFEWAKHFEGTGDNYGFSVDVDDDGNIYSTGYFQGTVDFDPGAGVSNLTSTGSGDIFIVKMDSNGEFAWAKQLGGSSDDLGRSITVDNDGSAYITGYFQGTVDFDPGAGVNNLTSLGLTDIYLLKLDTDGNFEWANMMSGTSYDYGRQIIADDAGYIYSIGYFYGGVADFDPGPGVENLGSYGSNDVYIQKLDSDGNYVWAKNMGGAGVDEGFAIDIDAAGNIYTTGLFAGVANFGDFTGDYEIESAGFEDTFIQKLNSDGDLVWVKTIRGIDPNGGRGVAVDPSGNVYTTGYFIGPTDFEPGAGVTELTPFDGVDVFVQKLDNDGNFLWAKQMGGLYHEYPHSIAVDNLGNAFITGQFQDVVDFDPSAGTYNLTCEGTRDAFVCKLDSSGDFVWANLIGGTAADEGYSIILDETGGIYSCGSFQGTVDFDPTAGTSELTSGGDRDIFIQKLSEPNPGVGVYENQDEIDFVIFPNPANELIQIKSDLTYDKIEIVDITGQVVMTSLEMQININHLQTGVYLVKAYQNDKVTMKRIAKQ